MVFTEEQIKALDAELAPERVARRQGPRGMMLSYVEGYDIIDTFNRIFGYDGWSHSIDKVDKLYRDESTGEIVFGATCTITIPGDSAIIGVRHSDVGVGTARNSSAGEIELAYKEAATDALKRAARALGNQFGNSLYDKASPLHAVSGGAAKSRGTSSAKSAPAAATGEFAPNLRNNVPLSDLPKPNSTDGKKYVCDGCGKEIKDSKKYLASEIAYMSIAQSGDIRCWNCKTEKAAA